MRRNPYTKSLSETEFEEVVREHNKAPTQAYASDYVLAEAIRASGFQEDDYDGRTPTIILRCPDFGWAQETNATLMHHSPFTGALADPYVINIKEGENFLPLIHRGNLSGKPIVVITRTTQDLGLLPRLSDEDVYLNSLTWKSAQHVADVLTGDVSDPEDDPLPWMQHANPIIWNVAFKSGMTSSRKLLELVSRLSEPFDGSAVKKKPVASKKSDIKLADCPGMGSAATWAEELIQDLTDYRQGLISWDDIDKGILLYGPPGCGKTRFAQALANSAGVFFLSTSSATWLSSKDGHLGTFIKAMKTDFTAAKLHKNSIIFIDEIDAIGSRESRDHNSAWTTGTVTALLEELDGIAGREGVVVIGATNRRDNVDPALLRSGRLDRSVEIPLPDAQALTEIFRVHLGDALLNEAIRPVVEAQALGGTGADVERWCREARRIARRGRREMTVADLEAVVRMTEAENRQPIGFCR